MNTTVPGATTTTAAPPGAADGAVLPPVPRRSVFPPGSTAASDDVSEDHEASDSGYSSEPEYTKAPDYVCHAAQERCRIAPDPDYRPAPAPAHRESVYTNADYGEGSDPGDRPTQRRRKRREKREVPDPDYRPDQGHRKRRERRKRPTSHSLAAHTPTTSSVPSYVSLADEYGLKVGAPNDIASQDTASLGVVPGDVSTGEAPPVLPLASTRKFATGRLAINTKQDSAVVAGPSFPRPPLAGSPYHHRLTMGLEAPTLTGAARATRLLMPPGPSTACSILLSIHSSSRVHAAKTYRIPVFRGHRNGETTSDKELFLQLRRAYNAELRSFWQRFFSLRGLHYIGVIDYTDHEAPVLLPLDGASRNAVLYAFNKPHKLAAGAAWVDWVFALKEQPARRCGLEFVQGWDARKIVVLAAVPWVCSVVTAVLWSAVARDVQAAVAVASYIMAAGGVALALLGVLSTLEG